MNDLTEWLRREGGVLGADVAVRVCDFGDGGGGRGMAAVRDVAPGETLLRIPKRLLLTHAAACAALPPLLPEKARRDPFVSFCAFLCAARKGDPKLSFWAPYVASLPTAAPPCCVAFTQPQRALLSRASPDIRLLSEKYAADAAAGYAALQLQQCCGGFRFEEYKWAASIVLSRSCYFAEGGICLVPYFDMLNHSDKAGTEAGFDGEFYCVKATKAFRAGEQVFIRYGSHDNAALIALYGFALRDNSCDRVRADEAIGVAMESVPECRAFPDQKQTMLFRAVGMNSARDLFFYPGGEVAWNVTAFLRIFCMDKADISMRGVQNAVASDQIVSQANEHRVRTVLRAACVHILQNLDQCQREKEETCDLTAQELFELFAQGQRAITEAVLRRI